MFYQYGDFVYHDKNVKRNLKLKLIKAGKIKIINTKKTNFP